MVEFYRKLSWWKGLSDFIVILILIGWLTGLIGPEFYNIAAILLIPGLISTLIFLIKSIAKDR